MSTDTIGLAPDDWCYPYWTSRMVSQYLLTWGCLLDLFDNIALRYWMVNGLTVKGGRRWLNKTIELILIKYPVDDI